MMTGVADKKLAVAPGGIVKPAGLGDGHVQVPASHLQAALEGATH